MFGKKPKHEHEWECVAVSTPQPSVAQAMGLSALTPVTAVTLALFWCPCRQPTGLMSVQLSGRWSLEQVKGGGAEVLPLTLVGSAGETDTSA